MPDVVRFDSGASGGPALVQTYDAGVTIDHWERLLPVERDGQVLRHVFQDCAHWWALAHHFLIALQEIHKLQLVHLDVKADNVCIPLAPATFSPDAAQQRLFPVFKQLALIDFAFSLVSGERLTTPLPIGWQEEYPYQSPRLLKALMAGRNADLQPTQKLDWRCDMYSLAAMLKRYLPAPERLGHADGAAGWTEDRHVEAKVLILKIRDAHDRHANEPLPHQKLIDLSGAHLNDRDLVVSLERGWNLAEDMNAVEATAPTVPLTPVTLIEPQVRVAEVADEGLRPAPVTLIEVLVPAAAHAEPTALAADQPSFGAGAGRAVTARPTLRRLALYAIPLIAFAAAMPWITGALRFRIDRPDAPPAVAEVLPEAPLRPSAPPQEPSADAQLPAVQPTQPTAQPTAQPTVQPTAPPVEQAGRPANDAARPAPMALAPDASSRRAAAFIADRLPALAARIEPQVEQVLTVAANAAAASQDREIIEAARSIGRLSNAQIGFETSSTRASARRLNAAARDAFWSRRSVAQALELQLRAFGDDPHDAEIAGNLAFYHLKASPPEPETARRLALHALATATARSGSARQEDWGNFAVASALSGRHEDATNALFVMLAASKDLNRSCRSVLSAYASHGERMKAPGEAMLARLRARGAPRDAPHCAWPPNWAAGTKFP